MKEMHEIHEQVLKYLLDYKKDHPGFTFGFRKMNNSNRLKLGYWFNGDDNYIAIPFYTGRDWKNRTPNIFFKIGREGHSFLEFSFTDSQDKAQLIRRIKANLKNVEEKGRGYIKNYHTTDYISALERFLMEDKPVIDELIVLLRNTFYSEKSYNMIDFYTEAEFQKSLGKINLFKGKLPQKELGLTQYLKTIKIKGSIPSIDIEIEDIPKTARFIFFTGKNGTGKTTILKSISTAIMGGKMHVGVNKHIYSLIPGNTEVQLGISNQFMSGTIDLRHGKVNDSDKFSIPFSAYGPFRSNVAPSRNLLDSELEKLAPCRSMFFDDAMMLSLDFELLQQAANNSYGVSLRSLPTEIIQQLIDLIPSLIPNLISIEAPMEMTIEDLWSETQYVFEDDEQNPFNPVTFGELSSGHKNLIAFLSDMIINLIWKQPNIQSLSELTGIVIIDEIDLHLHPEAQKALIEALADTLPDVQFIVSTHSPIPLLGAPKNSLIYRVTRTENLGIIAKRVDDKIHLDDLLPNAILTSPIFDMESITNTNRDSSTRIITTDDFQEIEFSQKIQSRIDDFLTDKKQEELIKLFEERRK
jgi:predicted ATPase